MNTVISKLLVYIYSGYNKDVYYEMSVYILSHLSIVCFNFRHSYNKLFMNF